MQGPHLRKYGVQTTVDFPLFEIDGVDFKVDAAHASGDTKIMKDEGDEANTTNGFTDEGQGYSIVLDATEMEAARIVVYVVDSATKVWLDTAFVVETYGNASAMHAVDLDDGVRAGLTALPNAAANAAGGLAISATGGVDLDAIETAASQIGTAGVGLTNIDLPNQTMDITGSLSGSVGSVSGAVGSVAGNVGGSTASVSGAVGSVTGAVGSVTGAVGSVTGAVGSVTGSVGSVAGNVDGSVASVVAAVAVAAGGIASAAFAAGAIDAAAIAADAIGASEFSQAAQRAIADEFLDRNLAGGGSGNTRSVRNALRMLRNKGGIVADVLTVYQEDDSTPAWTADITRTAGNPISEVDPT